MLTVYGTPRSRTSVVLWLLREMGMKYCHVDSPVRGEKHPEHLEVNPEGTMPTIKDDGFVLTESMAITYYLAKKYGGDMGPRDLQEEAKILRWTTWAVADVDRHIVALVNASGVDEDHPYDAEKYAEASEALRKPLQRFDKKLGDREFLVGGRLTVAAPALGVETRDSSRLLPLSERWLICETWDKTPPVPGTRFDLNDFQQRKLSALRQAG